MKAITLWQPWASLVAMGVKRIETRSWSTKYRGLLAIHAAKRPPPVGRWVGGEIKHDGLGELQCWLDHPWTEEEQADAGQEVDGDLHAFPMPLGAVVATVNLRDVVPIVGIHDLPDGPFVYSDGDWLQVHDGPEDSAPRYSEVEQLYGDYRAERWAWLLGEARTVIHPPTPARGRQGLWEWAE